METRLPYIYLPICQSNLNLERLASFDIFDRFLNKLQSFPYSTFKSVSAHPFFVVFVVFSTKASIDDHKGLTKSSLHLLVYFSCWAVELSLIYLKWYIKTFWSITKISPFEYSIILYKIKCYNQYLTVMCLCKENTYPSFTCNLLYDLSGFI